MKEWKPIDHFGDCTIEANNGDRRLTKEGVVVFQYNVDKSELVVRPIKNGKIMFEYKTKKTK